uniref:C1q domain-containing protein n=1 Tax=Phytophthora ramorum TaxID=164328 RepID=H3GTX1_PHYRM
MAATADGGAGGDVLKTLTTSLQSERKWRNVQTVLPESFELVARALVEQSRTIQKLQHRIGDLERLQSAAASSNTMDALEERVRAEMKRRASRLRKEVAKFAVLDDVALGFADCWRCVQVEQSFEQRCCKLEGRVDQLIESTQDQLKDHDLKFRSTRVSDEDKLTKLRQEMAKKVEALENKLAEGQTTKETALVPAMKEVAPTPEGEEVRRPSVRDLECSRFKLDAWKQLAEKADSARVEEVTCALMDSIQRSQESTMDEMEQLRHLNEAKVERLELVQVKQNMHNFLSVAESIQHELAALKRVVDEKMTVADAKELLDAQSTLNDLQKARQQVESAAAGEFASTSQLDTMNRQVQALTRQLRSEIYQARYIWKEGRPSAKQTIPWSSQVVNTNADVFLWQFGSDEVRLPLPGLYHLQAAFFTNYSPAIQVLVNGEPAVLLRSSAEAKEAPSCGQPVVRRLHHSAGNVAGLAVDVFLALPARALVSISYDLDEKAQGFLNLRKL